MNSKQNTIAFIWENFGPYHVDRLEATARALPGQYRIIGIEIGGSSVAYAWQRIEKVDGVERLTLFPAVSRKSVTVPRLVRAIVRSCLASEAKHVFLCNYNRVEVFVVAVLLRILGRRVYMMNESKFDDKPRVLWRELLKRIYCWPYHAVLVGGSRSADYFRLLGFKPAQIEYGYDTVSVDRVRTCANSLPAPHGTPFHQRYFLIVARLVPKKNISMALDAYARYCKLAGSAARDLYICGSGEEESLLRRLAEPLAQKVKFCGFLQATEVSRLLGAALALILPSTEEQWGLVVNEAIAMGLPVLCSTSVGARDLLVRTAVNGYVYEPDNSAGLAAFMYQLASDKELWTRQSEAAHRVASLADTSMFAASVIRLTSGKTCNEAPPARAPIFHQAP